MSSEAEALLPFLACGLLLFLAVFGLVSVALLVAAVVAYSRRSAQAQRNEIARAYLIHALISNGANAMLSVIAVAAVWIAMLRWALEAGPVGLVAVLGVSVFAALLVAVAASNWTALLGNRQLRAKVLALNSRGGRFVGVSDPARKSFFNQFLDTDDDFGLLRLEADTLEFDGARASLSVPRQAIRELRRPLMWQFFYLGSRWLEVEWAEGEQTRLLRLGSRERDTLLTCDRATAELHGEVAAWRQGRQEPGAI